MPTVTVTYPVQRTDTPRGKIKAQDPFRVFQNQNILTLEKLLLHNELPRRDIQRGIPLELHAVPSGKRQSLAPGYRSGQKREICRRRSVAQGTVRLFHRLAQPDCQDIGKVQLFQARGDPLQRIRFEPVVSVKKNQVTSLSQPYARIAQTGCRAAVFQLKKTEPLLSSGLPAVSVQRAVAGTVIQNQHLKIAE